MVERSLSNIHLSSEGRWFDPTFSHWFVYGGIAQSGERQTEDGRIDPEVAGSIPAPGNRFVGLG